VLLSSLITPAGFSSGKLLDSGVEIFGGSNLLGLKIPEDAGNARALTDVQKS
jgi:hypothetical protein